MARPKTQIGPCAVVDCARLKYVRDMCSVHYYRWRRTGDPLGRESRGTFEARFWRQVDKTETCWLWTGGIDRDGYGRTYRGKVAAKSHRVAYELLVGPIPEGLTIDHLCRVRNCVNPAHLEPVTAAENVRRAWIAREGAQKGLAV